MKRYVYLYDTTDDFVQDYLRIFCTSLISWKPKHLRKKSKYNGTGDFKNYFWSSLQNNYINMVKAGNSGKRSIASKCPLCEQWCASLSTHLIQHHVEFLWSLIVNAGFNFDQSLKCPFCQVWKLPRKFVALDDMQAVLERLKRHIVSKHSNYLFDYFREEFPGYIPNSASKPMSIYLSDQDDEVESNLYEMTDSNTKIEDLYNSGLTDIQQGIIYKIFNDRTRDLSVVYDAKLYNCTEEEFESELEDLKQKLFLCGIDGGGK
jgi:hypothetical protein